MNGLENKRTGTHADPCSVIGLIDHLCVTTSGVCAYCGSRDRQTRNHAVASTSLKCQERKIGEGSARHTWYQRNERILVIAKHLDRIPEKHDLAANQQSDEHA